MNQNLSLYRIFYTVALTGNISHAADELFISQPAVSKSIRKLEQSMNTSLFTRSSRGVQLTEDGELLFSHVKSAFQTLENAENQLRLRRELGMGQLRIGVSSTLCKYVLLPRLSAFIKAHPHLRVTISCQSTNQTLQMLENGDLDLGLTGRPENPGMLRFSPVMEIQDTFVTTRDYLDNLARQLGQPVSDSLSPEVSVSFLKNGVLMLLDQENLTRQYLDAHLKEHILFPENILETTSMDLLIDFARVGLGIAGVIREFVQAELSGGALLELPLPFPLPPREIGFLCREEAEYKRI
ncbi:LysR family transcriptional regulator [Candidatus Merdisoma sp. HCP28S3_D10]|uniref:LysR family transcriptional regulator n=1 Tax=unclassified Candidatus Merdisoma TaxID=3099611 RepID=UPI003F8C87C3